MATKQRATRYDIGAGTATLPDIDATKGDWAHDVRPSALVDEAAHWNEQTVPDLPLRISMSTPPMARPATTTAIPRSGTRHRAVSAPPPAPPLVEPAELGPSAPATAEPQEDARPSFVPHARARPSTWVPFAVAVTGIAAAVGVALGNASLSWHFGANEPDAPLPSAAARVLAPTTPVLIAPVTRPRETAGAALETRSRSGALTVPEVRYEDLPVLQNDPPSGTDTRAAGTRRRKVKAHAR